MCRKWGYEAFFPQNTWGADIVGWWNKENVSLHYTGNIYQEGNGLTRSCYVCCSTSQGHNKTALFIKRRCPSCSLLLKPSRAIPDFLHDHPEIDKRQHPICSKSCSNSSIQTLCLFIGVLWRYWWFGNDFRVYFQRWYLFERNCFLFLLHCEAFKVYCNFNR